MQRAALSPNGLVVLLLVASCAGPPGRGEGPYTPPYSLRSLAKNDIDRVLEVHVHESRAHLRRLMEKLYRRNPRELRKSAYTAEENARRLFDVRHDWQFPDVDCRDGLAAVRLSLAPGYQGDRVFAFVAGLDSMIMHAYGQKTEFFLFDSVDPQNLYNSARNLEIAAWKLRHDRDEAGEPIIYSVSLEGEPENLSYERLFGKLIGLQDTMAIVVAGKTGRTITKVIQRIATAAFLPLL
jgi:hypothetical protein